MFNLSPIYKYGIAGAAAVGIVSGIFFYGRHQGVLSGELTVSKLREQMAADSAKFERDAAEAEAKAAANVAYWKDKYDVQTTTLNNTSVKLTNQLKRVQQQSSSYVAEIERLSKTTSAPCDAALELADKQYGELAKFAVETADRADHAASVANTLNNANTNGSN